MIFVTKPFMPPIEEYLAYMRDIWDRQWITNNGPLVNQLELRLKEHLAINHMLYLSNGTIALQLAIKALGLSGEIITTPLSFVATTSTIVWENCKPVFVDIDEDTFNIDPKKIEAAITPNTQAILATHVYGNPCAVEEIEDIAARYNLKVIYDAAHCFGTKYLGKSIFEYGDLSTTSFHATKVFHTVEGGAIFSTSPQLINKLAKMRNFGFEDIDEISGLGINGKNSEMHAAMGLANLAYIDRFAAHRKQLYDYYDLTLENLEVKHMKIRNDTVFNHAYYPIVFETEDLLLENIKELNRNWIYPRRYFYPSLSKLPYIEPRACTPIADRISSCVLCLPMYNDLKIEEVDLVCRILLRVQNNTIRTTSSILDTKHQMDNIGYA